MKENIPFNKIFLSGNEMAYIEDAIKNGHLSSDGPYTKLCKDWLEENTGCKSALMTNSCTSALEMTALLLDLKPGDEIIMPSFTFVSTANAFVLKGAIPVFVDIREDTLNIDENLIEKAITAKTKAIVAVHYAGVSCNMDAIQSIASTYNIPIIEDAAQGIMAHYNGNALGSMGDMGCLSFHDTKNIIAGEGGALLINNSKFLERAEIIRDKGTNRKKFMRGEIDKYTWVDQGSSYVPSEIISAFLFAQLEKAELLTMMRLKIWQKYHNEFINLERDKKLVRPNLPQDTSHNGHIYYLVLNSNAQRELFIKSMKEEGVICSFHYVPLHNSPAGIKWANTRNELLITEKVASKMVRLPIWPGIDCNRVIEAVYQSI